MRLAERTKPPGDKCYDASPFSPVMSYREVKRRIRDLKQVLRLSA
jgi:hypothetical protein